MLGCATSVAWHSPPPRRHRPRRPCCVRRCGLSPASARSCVCPAGSWCPPPPPCSTQPRRRQGPVARARPVLPRSLLLLLLWRLLARPACPPHPPCRLAASPASWGDVLARARRPTPAQRALLARARTRRRQSACRRGWSCPARRCRSCWTPLARSRGVCRHSSHSCSLKYKQRRARSHSRKRRSTRCEPSWRRWRSSRPRCSACGARCWSERLSCAPCYHSPPHPAPARPCQRHRHAWRCRGLHDRARLLLRLQLRRSRWVRRQ
mmetsp:Transcript_30546/g.99762  ORF Transcript_30546/g.99762 Transcript_30546/m.99762 type:complete len:265 (+) Transcript_30546:950-1744(+)